MKALLVLFGLMMTLVSFGQKRVTSYTEQSGEGRAFVKEVNGVNYLININPDDEIIVSQIDDTGNLKFLYSTEIRGIGSSVKISFYNSKIISYGTIGIHFYDFVTRKRGGVDGTSTGFLIGQDVIHARENGFIVKGMFSGYASIEYFYFDYNGTYRNLPSSVVPLYVGENHVYVSRKLSGSNKEYYVYNPINEDQEILVDATSNEHGIHFRDNKAWYLDIENAVMQMNLSTYKRTYVGITSSYNKNTKQVLTQNDLLMIYQGTKDSMFLEIFNNITKSKIKELKFKVKGIVDNKYFEWQDDMLLFKTKEGVMGSIDIENGTIQKFDVSKNYVFYNWPLIENRYLVAPYLSDIKFLDTQNGMEYITNSSDSDVVPKCPGIIKLEDKFIVSFVKSVHEPETYVIDIANTTISETTKYSSFNSGLFSGSTLFKIQNEIVLAAQNIYGISNSQSKQINNLSLIENQITNYASADGMVYYASLQNDSLSFYSFNGVKETKILGIEMPENEIKAFGVTPKYVYYLDTKKHFYRVDKLTLSSENLSKYENTFLAYFFLSFEGNFFFKTENHIVKLNDDGSEEYVYSFSYPFDNFYVEFNHKLYLLTENKIYIWQNNTFQAIIEHVFDNPFLVNVPNSKIQLVSFNFNRIWGILDGDILHYIPPVAEGSEMKKVFIEKDFALFTDKLNNSFLLDYNKKLFIPIEGDHVLKSTKVLSVFVMKNDTLALVSDGQKLVTYVLSDYFRNAKVLSELSVDRNTQTASTTINVDYGLIQTDINNYYLSADGKLTAIPEILTSNGTERQSEVKGENIYFFGYNFEWGRQLYSLRKTDINTVGEFNEASPHKKAYTLYPNPAHETLYINGLNENSFTYTLTNTSGIIIRTAQNISNQIDVHSLDPGVYYLQIHQGREINVSSFVKLK